jgi:hypothetical protein
MNSQQERALITWIYKRRSACQNEVDHSQNPEVKPIFGRTVNQTNPRKWVFPSIPEAMTLGIEIENL